MVLTEAPRYFPEPPGKKWALGGGFMALIGSHLAAKELAKLTTVHAAEVLTKTGIGSLPLNKALERMSAANQTDKLTNVLNFAEAPVVHSAELILPALVIGAEYVDTKHGDPTPKAPSGLKEFFRSVHMLVGSGATALAPALIGHIPTMVSEFTTSLANNTVTQPELIAVGAETAVMAYATFSLVRAGRRIWDWVTYPNLEARRQKKADVIKRSREIFLEETKPPTPRPRTNEEILGILRVRTQRAMAKTMEKLEQNHPSNSILDHHHSVVKGVLADLRGAPKDIPHFLKFEHRQTSSRLNQQKR